MSGQLDYWRADNMWAAAGRPDGDLGKESITLPVGQTRVFVTDWAYEKRRNDGTNFYGSHGRVLQNAGTVPIDVVLKGPLSLLPLQSLVIPGTVGKLVSGVIQRMSGSRIRLSPGQKVSIQNDIAEVLVPKLT
jgi:hypothetical protein